MRKKRPECYIKDGSGGWPGGDLEDDAPPEAHLVLQISKNLEKWRNDVGPKQLDVIAERIRVSRTTIENLRWGKTWPDVLVIARLEILFNRKLWNSAHQDASSVKS